MKRLFVAIRISPGKEFLSTIHLLEDNLRHEKIKWVEDQNIHITLKFLGKTDENKVPGITSVLKDIATGVHPFSLCLKNLGIFGSRYDPRVVWIGIEPYKELVSLMKQIKDAMVPLGFEADRQNLVPHLTLGRIKGVKDKSLFQQTIDQFRQVSSGNMSVDSFILFESILKKEGPTYVALETFPMQKPV